MVKPFPLTMLIVVTSLFKAAYSQEKIGPLRDNGDGIPTHAAFKTMSEACLPVVRGTYFEKSTFFNTSYLLPRIFPSMSE